MMRLWTSHRVTSVMWSFLDWGVKQRGERRYLMSKDSLPETNNNCIWRGNTKGRMPSENLRIIIWLSNRFFVIIVVSLYISTKHLLLTDTWKHVSLLKKLLSDWLRLLFLKQRNRNSPHKRNNLNHQININKIYNKLAN